LFLEEREKRMSLSDRADGNGSAWVALAADPIHPAGGDAGAAFRLLYATPADADSPAFVPLYGLPSTESPAPVEPEEIRSDSGPAKTDPEDDHRRSYAEGFSQGHAEGLAAGKQETQAQVDRMRNLLKEMEGLWPKLVGTYENQLIELVCRVAEKVVSGQTAVDQDTVKRIILDAFQMVPEPVEVTIEIHPDDARSIEAIKADFFQTVKGLQHMTLISNPSVQPGGCRLKTRLGQVDGTLETRLEAVRNSVMDICRRRVQDGDGASD